MSGASRRTWQKHHVAHFSLTLEAEPPMSALAKESLPRPLDAHRGLAGITKQLAAILETHRLPATWAVGDPAHSATTSLVTLSAQSHELAILGDQHWLGPTAGRTRFARELARRVAQARVKGIEVVTLVPRVAPVAEHIDLVVKHGLRAVVATPGAVARRTATPLPRTLHYGVWEFSTAERLPAQSSWLFAAWKLKRRIRRAARDAADFHLAVDVAGVEQQGYVGIKLFDRMARCVATLRDRGLLRVETLGAAAARLSDLPAATPQRSILRAA